MSKKHPEEQPKKSVPEKIDEIWTELRKKPSTATLLVGAGIIATVIMGIITLVYFSHQTRMAKLEETDKATNLRIDAQYVNMTNWMQAIYNKLPSPPEAKKMEPKKVGSEKIKK